MCLTFHKRAVLLVGFALSFLLVGGITIWMWPLVQVADSEWVESRRGAYVWSQVQRTFSRQKYLPPQLRANYQYIAYELMSYYGGEEWVARLVNIALEANHVEERTRQALLLMTNQNVAPDVATLEDWWNKNRTKTQNQWIRDGFTQKGLSLGSPLNHQDIEILLHLLEQPTSSKIEQAWFWNAFRLLRSNGCPPFDPRRALIEGEHPENIKGMLIYAGYSLRLDSEGL